MPRKKPNARPFAHLKLGELRDLMLFNTDRKIDRRIWEEAIRRGKVEIYVRRRDDIERAMAEIVKGPETELHAEACRVLEILRATPKTEFVRATPRAATAVKRRRRW